MARRRSTRPLTLTEWIGRYQSETVDNARFRAKPKQWKGDTTPVCLVGGPRDRFWYTVEMIQAALASAREMRTWTELASYQPTGRRVLNPHYYYGPDLDHDRGFEVYEYQPTEEPP